MCTFKAWKHCSNSWSIVETCFAQGLAKVKLGGTYWRSLMLIFKYQVLHEISWNELPSIVVGVETNEFHEFWWIYVLQGLNWKRTRITKYKYLKWWIGVHHCKELIETHEIEFWFTQIRVHTIKLRLPEDCKWASIAVQSKLGISPSSRLRF
jgi:hypothetical protein